MTWEPSTATVFVEYDDSFDGGVATLELREKRKPGTRVRREREVDPDATMTTLVTPNYESRWLSKSLQQVDELGSLTEFKAIAGVMPPNQVAIHNAKQVLTELAKAELCPSRISPSSDEGICISFSLSGKYADIECFNSGDIMAARSGVSVETNIWRVGAHEILQTVQKISKFISEP